MRKRKRLYIAGIIIIMIVTVFIGADLLIFKTKRNDDTIYVNGEDAFVRQETTELWDRGKLEKLPSVAAPGSREALGFDLRSYDISHFSLSGQGDDLKKVSFDSFTKWPADLPDGFYPDKIMETGMNPGLGIRELHEMGITGEGVSVAIIDQPLNINHKEYAGRIRSYELLHSLSGSSMHGAAVTSIAVGENCGVAPGADVYYIASAFVRLTPIGFVTDVGVVAKAIDRVLEINSLLPDSKKIRVVSISMGYVRSLGGNRVIAAIERAKEQGVFVITTACEYSYNFDFAGLGRDMNSDPDNFESYVPGQFWEDSFYSGYLYNPDKILLVPMDSRTYASSSSSDGYEFCSVGGMSWSVPWLSGLYALCVQVNPDITPEIFIKEAFATGTRRTIEHNGKEYILGTIVDPVRLVEAIR